MAKKIVSHTDLDVYRKSFDVAMQVFDQTYDEVLRMLVAMINDPSVWLIK